MAALDDSDGAIAALKRSLAIDRANRGENHPYLAISNDELAELYQRTGVLQLSRAVWEMSCRAYLNHFGPGHAYALASQTALATAHKKIRTYPQVVAATVRLGAAPACVQKRYIEQNAASSE